MQNKKLIQTFCMILACLICFPFAVTSNTGSYQLNYVSDYYLDVGYNIDIKENLAFVADNDGISVIDISDPTDIFRLTLIDLPSAAFGVQIIDDTAYVGCSESGLYIVNITDIYNPIILGHENTLGFANKVFIHNDYALIADYYSGLGIIDISNRSDPIFEYLYYDTGNVWDVVTYSNIAYVANRESLEVLNITDPTAPVQLSTLPNTDGVTHLSINGEKLFIGRHGQGFKIYDISTPASPSLLGTYSDIDDGEELGLRGNDTFLSVADNYGIELFDVSSLPTITKLDEFRDGVGGAHDLEVVGNYIYAVDGLTGIFVLEIEKINGIETSTTGYSLAVATLLITSSLTIIFSKQKTRRRQ